VVEVSGSSATLTRGYITLKLSCAGANCAGTAEVVIWQVAKSHHTRKTVVLAEASYTAAEGRAAVLRLRVTSVGAPLLHHVKRHPMKTQAVVTVRGGKEVTKELRVS
jgi:hypothetical protein